MKKKLLTRAFGIFLSAAVVFTSLPTTAFATGVDEVSTVAVEENSEQIQEELETQVSENSVGYMSHLKDVDIFSLDWKNATDEEFDYILGITDFETTGAWLKSLSEEDFNEAIARNTVLNKEMTVSIYDVEEDGKMTETDVVDTSIYYEYCLKVAKPTTKAQKFQHKSGYYDYKFIMGTKVSHFRMKISDLDTTKETSENQKATLAIVVVSQPNGNFANFKSSAGNYNAGSDGYKEKNLNRNFDKEGNYYNLTVGFAFTKPAGYSVSLTYENKNTGNGDVYYYDNGNFRETKRGFKSDTDVNSAVYESLIAHTNLYTNTTVGGSSQNAPAVPICYTFTFVPSTYTINYHGYGATGGATASQLCTYDVTYPVQQNGYTRKYTVTYSGNGGTSSVASNEANYTFKGWGYETLAGVTHQPGSQFINARTSGTGTFYAMWNSASVTLPTATRTGHTFKGWSTSNTATSGQAANTTYTPTQNTTLYATWTANTIPVTYKSDNTTLGTANVLYTANLTLADYSNKKTGYNFVNWTGSNGGTYTNKATVKGSDLSTGNAVTLTANWTPKNIKVTYKDGDKVLDTENMTYDKTYTLKNFTKPGYEISDWTASWTNASGEVCTETYENAQEVKNLTTGEDITLTANWKVAETLVTYKDGDKVIGTDTFTYDVAGRLKSIKTMLTKAGYTFKNWLGSDGKSYSDTQEVMNLTEGEDLTLTAQWEANKDTPYTVIHMKETEWNSNQYKEADKQTLKGTTDTSVTPAVNTYEGYQSPNTQSVIIKGNGSTVVTYKYKANKPEDNKYESPSGLTDEDIQKIIDALNNGFTSNLDLKGVTYEIIKNTDGTLSIKLVSDNGQENINIPGQINLNGTIYSVSEVQAGSFKNNKKIKTVAIGTGISKIGKSAFEGCTNLKSVSFGAGLITIGDKAFKGCTSLAKITTPSTLQVIGASAFEGCTKLATVSLNKGLLTIGNKAFYKCSALKKIKIPDTVLKMGKYAFASCKKLAKVTTSKACLEMGEGVFANDTALKSITLKTKLAKIPKKAFYKCTKLKTVKLGSGTTDIGASAFEGCTKLTKVTIPKNVMTISKKAFFGCSKLGKVTIKSTSLKSIGSSAFKSCKKGIKFTVPKSKLRTYKTLLKGKY